MNPALSELEILRAELVAARKQNADLERQKTETVRILQNYDRLWIERDQARAELKRINERNHERNTI